MATSTVSCDRCRMRKVKCDRAVPCSNCQRQNATCHTSSEGPRRRGKGKSKESIHARLARLESLLEDVARTSTTDQASIPKTNNEATKTSEVDISTADDRLHRYMAGSTWSQFSDQIEGLREVLLPDSDDEDTSPPTTLSASAGEHTSRIDLILYGNPGILVANPEGLQHPSLTTRQQLFSIYCANVDPLCKIIHRPTVCSQLEKVEVFSQHDVGESGVHALLFAVYAAAIMSLSDAQLATIMSDTKSDALSRFSFATEYFLIKSRYIQSHSVIPIQALTIYLLVARAQDPGQRHWALMALAVQLAKGIGLHSAKATNNFRPLDREIRLRLWHTLRTLDFRAAIDRGMDPIIKLDSYDTPLPTNLNDNDLTNELTITPLPREGISGVSFCIISSEGVTLMTKLVSLDLTSPNYDPTKIWSSRLQLIEDFDNSMKQRFNQHCDDQIPIQWAVKYSITLFTEMGRLLVVRPMSRLNGQSVPLPPEIPRQIFERAIRMLQADELLYQTFVARGFWWYTWVHWYVLAVALVEICANPEFCREEGLWGVMQRAYERQSRMVADTAAGALWRPVKRLMDRVESLRQTVIVTQPDQTSSAPTIHADFADPALSNNLATTSCAADHREATFEIPNTHHMDIPPIQDHHFTQLGLSDSFLQWDQFMGGMTDLETTPIWDWNI